MSIPRSTNGCFNPLIYLHGDTIIKVPHIWPQFRTELIFAVFHIELYVYCPTGIIRLFDMFSV